MNKFALFTLQELRSLQNVISNNVENVRCDSVDSNGENISASMMTDEEVEAIHADTLIQEQLLDEVFMEIARRI